MPSIPFALSSYERSEGDLPGWVVENMYAESTASEGVVLQSRPPLSDRAANMGSGPVSTLYRRDGVASGALLGVSAGRLYSGSTALGIVTGSGPASIAGNETGVLVCAGEDLHSWNGTTFGQVTLPDGASFDAIKVLEGASRFIVLRKNTGRYYFTPALQQTVSGLDFATAESESDQVLDALFLDDRLILFGSETVEFHANTTDNNLPFRSIEGAVIERGILATGCATAFGRDFAWVTDRGEVCVGSETNVISNEGLEARITASTNVSLWRFFIDGLEFLALRLDGETEVFSRRSKAWSKFTSYSQTNWVPCCYAQGVFGSGIDGRTLQWGTDYRELGGTLVRLFRFGFPLNGGSMQIDNLRIRVNPGHTPFLADNFADPTIEVRLSRDAGQTWDDWEPTSLGEVGAYDELVEWRGLDMASYPGFLGECRVADPVPLRVSGVQVNEPWGGR